MNLINQLKTIYGYDNPIFLKDIRIGGRSKTSIKEELSRAYQKNLIKRKSPGIYYFESDKEFGSGVNFIQILEKKYIYSDGAPDNAKELFIEGFYSGLTFVNQIGISQQVPAIFEITTNKTSSKKRVITINGLTAIIRKSKTTVDFQNYKILQFLDMFHFIEMNEVIDNKDLIISYAKKIGFDKYVFSKYVKYYGPKTIKKLVEGGILNGLI